MSLVFYYALRGIAIPGAEPEPEMKKGAEPKKAEPKKAEPKAAGAGGEGKKAGGEGKKAGGEGKKAGGEGKKAGGGKKPAAGAAAEPSGTDGPRSTRTIPKNVRAMPDTVSREAYSARTLIEHVLAAGKKWIGQTATVAGWARTIREQGSGDLAFVELNDGSCVGGLQIVVSRDKCADLDAVLAEHTGSSLIVTGVLVASPGKGQEVELAASSVHVCGPANPLEYPLSKGRMSLEHLRAVAHLRPRTKTIACATRVRNALAHAVHLFFQERQFLYIHTPLITASDCEGAGEMFRVTTLFEAGKELPKTATGAVDWSQDFFKAPAMLTVSGQLNVETYCCALGNTYTFGPTFRAENSHTTRHLSEFWMIEPELAFADLFDDMRCAEDLLKYCIGFVMDKCAADIEFFEEFVEHGLIDKLYHVRESSFARCTYTEAIERLEADIAAGTVTFEKEVFWGVDLAAEHERYLCERVFGRPTIVYNYPKELKSFYMRLNDDMRTVAAMDILCPKIGEMIGGSQREERLGLLELRLMELGMPVENYSWYLDLRRFGSMPHAGFGLGFERLICFVTGLTNIRDVIPFPRYPGNAAF